MKLTWLPLIVLAVSGLGFRHRTLSASGEQIQRVDGDVIAVPKRIQFAGYEWSVKDSQGRRVGPGDNYFGRTSVSAGIDGVRLKVQANDGRLECGEIVLLPDLSYGTYRFEVATDLSRIANSLTLGMFLWSDREGFAHRELDIEAGRWAQPQNDDMQFVLQPYAVPGNMLRFDTGRLRGPSTQVFSWTPGRITFETVIGGVMVRHFVIERGVPPPGGGQHVRINLWNTTHTLPTDGLTEVLVTGFSYEPWR